MTNYSTTGSTSIPNDILKVTPAFKKKVVLAFLGLIVFIVFYFGLMIWFGYQTYHLFYLLGHGAENTGFLLITGICFAILTIFMFKSLLFFNKKTDIPYKELHKEDQPDLYAFIHKVADETGAPKPHKIFLSDRVNASVFYDLSLINIIIPSKKNLEVGMGLLNVLNLTEFKAILAHEFGHFAQRSMLLGRYVYVAQQLAQRIVLKRDILDRGLAGLSAFDLRVAWIGWILSIIVWAIRSLIRVLFGIVVISERALSREMEFQADNVAVSVSGSDALIYGLHKLRAADEGYRASLAIVNTCLQEKKAVNNLFELQSHFIRRMRWVLDDENYGTISSSIKQEASTRIFKNGLINPPEMWATHPSDMDRENNAKRSYLFVPIDPRGAIELVQKKDQLFEEITAKLIATAEIETELMSTEESILKMDQELFGWTFLDPKFKSVYHSRSTFRNFESINELYNGELSGSIDEEYAQLYPDTIKDDLELLRELEEEIALLEAAKNEVRTVENKKIVHRGNEISRKEIPSILLQLRNQEHVTRNIVKEHDRRCRLVNYKAASTIHPSYANYLKSLAELVHYAEHTQADLVDMYTKLQKTLFVIFADNRVTDAEQSTLVVEANRLWNIMLFASENMKEITLNDRLLERLKISTPEELFEEFKFEEASVSNLESWLNNYGGWYESCFNSISQLRNTALELLIEAEGEIQTEYLTKKPTFSLQGLPLVPSDYPKLVFGSERKLDIKLSFWDKFQGEIGLFPTVAKFSAAALILITAILIGKISIDSTLYIKNAFDIPITVSVDGNEHRVRPNSHLDIIISDDVEIVAYTESRDTIDHFIGAYDAGYRKYIYNIGSGDYLQNYEVVYGYWDPSAPEIIGPKRWFPISADYIFVNPPESMQTKNGGTSRTCIASILTDPTYLPELDLKDPEVQRMIINHVRYDHLNTKYLSVWMQMYSVIDPSLKEVKSYAERFPDNISAQRLIIDSATEQERLQLVSSFKKRFERTQNPDFKYLEIRSNAEGLAQDSSFLAAAKSYPQNGWLNLAAGYICAREGDWLQGYEHYRKAMEGPADLSEMIAVSYVRLRRMKCKLDRLSFNHTDNFFNPFLEYALSVDKGLDSNVESEIELIPYYLNTGDFEKVESLLSNASQETIDRFSWLRAASEPDNSALLEAAIHSDYNHSLSTTNRFTAIGILAAKNRDYSAILKQLKVSDGDKEIATTLKEFIRLIKKNDFVGANKILKKTDSFELNTFFKLTACIILKEKVPYEWWEQTDAILFAHEKPYLGYCIKR